MEHAYALSASRWRTATIAASALAALELAALGAIGANALAHTVSHDVRAAALDRVAGPAPEKHDPAPGRAVLARGETAVLVLNGNGVSGAAAAGAERVRALGYLVSGIGNANAQGTRTIVMYRGSFRAEAQRLARDVHAQIVTPLDGLTPSQLMGAQLALVLGR